MFEDLKPHLTELRTRMVYVIIFFFISALVAFYFHNYIMDFITKPLHDVLHALKVSSHSTYDGKITTHKVGGAFFVALRVSATTGVLVSFPFILFHVYRFIAPGLYKNEKSLIFPFLFGGTVMFALGLAFSYFLVIPYGFRYLITFGMKNYVAYINIEDYIGFFMTIMVAFAISFELPVIIFLLSHLKVVTDRTLTKFFRYAIIIIFIFAALITPPDVITQILLALPLIVLYIISILIAKKVNPYIKEENEEEIDDNDEEEKE